MVRMLVPALALTFLCACQPAADDASPQPPAAAQPATAATATAPRQAAPGALVDPATGADCAGNDVRITRDDSRTVLHGDCGAVTITANGATLNVDNTRSLHVEGDRVTVLNEEVGEVVVRSSDVTLNLTRVQRADLSGERTTLLARELGALRFSGNDNTANVDGTPQVEDLGRGNKVM